MLCCSGIDAITVAPAAFSIVRGLLPSSPALFLATHDGEVRERVHEDCPDHVHKLCVEGGDLFEQPGEPTFKRLYCDPGAPKLGPLLNPPPGYYKSNTYQLLVRGSGQHHCLDARLEADGRPLGALCLFREEGVGFDRDDMLEARRIATYFEHALAANRPVWHEADRAVEAEAMVISNTRGELLFASPAAQALLNEIPLVRRHWPDRSRLPPYCLRVIDMLRGDEADPLRMPALTLPVPGGMLEMRAQWLNVPFEGKATDPDPIAAPEQMVGIMLTRTIPMSLRIWSNLNGVRLSPTQLEVAYWMATGGGREAARARMAISDAVLRDCVKAVYERLECSTEAELAALLRAPPVERGGHPAATVSPPVWRTCRGPGSGRSLPSRPGP